MGDMNCIRNEADFKQITNCQQTISELESSFEELSTVLSMTGNNVRLKILFLLSKEEKLCVCDLSDILSMNVSAISQHLKKLKERRMIQPERKAQTIFYSLCKEYEALLLPFFAMIEENNILETR